jgi:SepF-like predicted cell division protein (DUF552 family)
MKEVLDFVKKNLGLEEEEATKEEQETIIVPEHSLYEIILMKAKDLDDIEDALNQIIDEKNPIILDMSGLEKDNPEDFKIAGEKLKHFRENIGGEAILICKNGKKVIIITPPEIKLVRK